MNSSELVIHLKKQGISQNKVAEALGLEATTISSIRHKRRKFTADQLGRLVQAKIISKETFLKVNAYDRLKDKKLYRYVASLMAVGSLQVMSQVQDGFNQLCILC